jgi:hypothetical protein
MWKANGKSATLLLFLWRCFLGRHHTVEVKAKKKTTRNRRYITESRLECGI